MKIQELKNYCIYVIEKNNRLIKKYNNSKIKNLYEGENIAYRDIYSKLQLIERSE